MAKHNTECVLAAATYEPRIGSYRTNLFTRKVYHKFHIHFEPKAKLVVSVFV